MSDFPKPDTSDMTEREMLIEIIETMRAVADALSALGNSPMLGALIPGGIKL